MHSGLKGRYNSAQATGLGLQLNNMMRGLLAWHKKCTCINNSIL